MKQLTDLIHSQSTLTVATVGPAGAPAAADLYFAADDFPNFYFISEPHARHAQNIAANPQVAGTIHRPAWDWQEIQGVQFRGQCRPLTAVGERTAALARYGHKFSFLHAFAAVITRYTVFRISPTWLRWLDNSVNFAHKQEWVVKNGQWVLVE